MTFYFNDHLHTTSFTPREHQIELLYAAQERNIIICLGKTTEQTFIVTKLIQESAIGNRKTSSLGGKRTIYLLKDEQTCAEKAKHIEQATDLQVWWCANKEELDHKDFQCDSQVFFLTVEVCYKLLKDKIINPSNINVLVIDKCHNLVTSHELAIILNIFRTCDSQTKIIGFAVPLYSLTMEPGQLSFEIERIESLLQCQIETASDLLSILRYSPKPKEYLLEYKIGKKVEEEQYLRDSIATTMEFLKDHRYDPTEIYNDEFLEEIQKIPNPVEKPIQIICDLLHVLDTLGLWAADKAAFILLLMVEKLKIKTPYERHYLLLCVVATMLIKLRAYCDQLFGNVTEKEKILKYSTPKIHKLIEILKTFTPLKKEPKEPKVDDTTTTKVIKEENAVLMKKPGRNLGKKPRTFRPRVPTDPDLLCGLIFVKNSLTAKVLFYLLSELSKSGDNFEFLSPLFTCEKTNDDIVGGRDLELEHRKQEEVLKKFRIHECNLLIATSILEEGIDIPKCNLVIRFEFPISYQSYVQCKSRARAVDALHILLVPEDEIQTKIQNLAHYHYIEKILLSKCSGKESNDSQEIEADLYDELFPLYKPLEKQDAPKVSLNSAIALINRYCAKLPSDTFTKLTAEWRISRVTLISQPMFICTLRLPINSPLKYTISSYPMPSQALAKRCAALRLCVQLHKENELDDYLLPIGKENFKANPEDDEVPPLPEDEVKSLWDARPGTTKRRQYYYKKIADALIDCNPKPLGVVYLYHISMVLSCPLPEEQNTRGRRIYPPEEALIGFGILTSKKIPKMCKFPIYTRSGEVIVDLKLYEYKTPLTEKQIKRLVVFHSYTFTNVLRLQKYLMLFDPAAAQNSYVIVPVKTVVNNEKSITIDWEFVDCIYSSQHLAPRRVPDEDRRDFTFDANKYNDAVIMPWYRNRDQPQYFYVAEICTHLNPKSSFPGADYKSFDDYYSRKYGINIQNHDQPLLDVDHTSARLNFLTPRYVNRKGVALPTSSEETKRAKRENLEQKQILVAELCDIHPFSASLWRQAVCLPCILYRVNALLLADQIRCEVGRAMFLGTEVLDASFEWPALDFGWNLHDVLMKSKDDKVAKTAGAHLQTQSKGKEIVQQNNVSNGKDPPKKENVKKEKDESDESLTVEGKEADKNNVSCNDDLEIGMWSNEMLESVVTINADETPPWSNVRYGSPTYGSDYEDDEIDSEFDDYDDFDGDDDDDPDLDNNGVTDCLKIAYTSDNVAEAFDKKGQAFEAEKLKLSCIEQMDKTNCTMWNCEVDLTDINYEEHKKRHIENVETNKVDIVKNGTLVPSGKTVAFERKVSKVSSISDKAGRFQEYIGIVGQYLQSEMDNPLSARCNMISSAKNGTEVRKVHLQNGFSFDYQPELNRHSGPSPSIILQALTMSNANDGINLERLETIGDSFLKYAITTYLFCAYPNIHEGKLSHLRSKQVSNLNLYRLGHRKCLGDSMIATKFEPHDNWLPPCYYVPKELEQALIESGVPSAMWNQANINPINGYNEIDELVRETEEKLCIMKCELNESIGLSTQFQKVIPYNLMTQHSIPDKSIADCVEALIGAYLIACGPSGALLFMTYLGIHVLPSKEVKYVQDEMPKTRPCGSTPFVEGTTEDDRRQWTHKQYLELYEPPSPLFENVFNASEELENLLDGYDKLEKDIGYTFRDRSYLLQAFTHASYQKNRLTDCYQRLEFLGDAVLDYLITRHLYEDRRQHSPGALTDLRSALVNNTIFASLAVRCGFHKYFKHVAPGLHTVIDRFVRIQTENGHSISEEYYLLGENELDEAEEAEDIEVPKALGDVFESLAGAIFLDSKMSLDAVWDVYFKIMKAEIEQFSSNVPKSPIRELLELEPETAKFGKPEKLADGRRVRVTVEVFGKGSFKGIGRNYRIAKCTAAKCALKKLKKSHSYGKNRK